MFELMGRMHNEIDGTLCYGYLQYVGFEMGTQGEICTYRCPQCGREIRNLEGYRHIAPFGTSNLNDNDGFGGGFFGGGWL